VKVPSPAKVAGARVVAESQTCYLIENLNPVLPASGVTHAPEERRPW